MARPALRINLTAEQREILESIARSRESSHSLVIRAQIILKLAECLSNFFIAQLLGLCDDTVSLWRHRWAKGCQMLEKVMGKPPALKSAIIQLLADAPRSGSPGTFEAEKVCLIIALACETPPDYLSHWTREELAREVVKRGIVESISPSTIGRILNQAELKPHRSKYWLNHEVEDEAIFRQEVRDICQLYHQAEELHENGIHLVSTDEKTGIQALERIHPTLPMEPCKPEAVEFEYERHGTQALIANFEVATGKIVAPSIGDTRTEEDFTAHIQATIDTDPQGKWIFVCDQLNTHKSASLVRAVAAACGLSSELGEKGTSGILKNMDTRAKFLQDDSHRIRFIYTPKHCSWLNQVEIWFGILSRRLLKRGNFTSKENLKERILRFIDFFNETLAKPFRWTYIGKPLLA